jgi:Protein of unknown function (DUF3405)
MKGARLFVTHVWSPDIESEFLKLLACDDCDTWLLLDSRLSSAEIIAARYPRHHIFSEASLRRLPHAKMPTLRGNQHLPLIDFFNRRPDYDFYWFIEYDVRYTGDWSDFFERFDLTPCDLCTAHIRRFHEEPFWWWWPTFRHEARRISPRHWIRSFNVIYRISNNALQFLDRALRCGWVGHYELLIATLLHHNGFRLLDFGGHGSFVEPGSINSVYTSRASLSGGFSPHGTIRYRPPRAATGSRENMLYHPVKPSVTPQILGL